MRLGGLYALERLANNNESQRQTIVNVICAYLRMPYERPRKKRRRYAGTAQRILSAHLLPSPDSYWAGVALDLTEATLMDLDFSRCRLENATFAGAVFHGRTGFVEATFVRGADFNATTFHGSVTFFRARCADAWFAAATFHGFAGFDETEFARDAMFGDATFHGDTHFGKARFLAPERATFEDAVFANGIPEELSAHLGDGRAE